MSRSSAFWQGPVTLLLGSRAIGAGLAAFLDEGEAEFIREASSHRSPAYWSGTVPNAWWGKKFGRSAGRPQQQFHAWAIHFCSG
jgi:hypothetical protein